MASRKKTYVRTKDIHRRAPKGEEPERACFMSDVLDGTIQASDMTEVRNPQGKFLRIEYTDPDG